MDETVLREVFSIARRLGYEQYARHVAVRLRAETPSNPALCNIGS